MSSKIQFLDYNSLATPIQDLINVLDSFDIDYCIAGGYPRDMHTSKTFSSDVDVFIFDGSKIDESRLSKNFKVFKFGTGFADLFMIDANNFGAYKFPVQLISWYKNIDDIFNAFDYEHCKFVMFPKTKTAYCTEEALQSIASNTLVPTKKTSDFFKFFSRKSLFDSIVQLENIVYRTCKFTSRGMVPSPLPLEATLTFLEERVAKDVQVYSKILGGATLGSETLEGMTDNPNSKTFPLNEVLQNLCSLYLKWLVLPADLPLFLVSTSYNMRKATKLFLEPNDEKIPNTNVSICHHVPDPYDDISGMF
jgi:hypothetical protein